MRNLRPKKKKRVLLQYVKDRYCPVALRSLDRLGMDSRFVKFCRKKE